MPVGLILQPTYRIRDRVPVVRLFGRLEEGGAFLIEDDRFRPYFFVPARDAASLATEPDVTIEASPLQSLTGDPVARIYLRVLNTRRYGTAGCWYVSRKDVCSWELIQMP